MNYSLFPSWKYSSEGINSTEAEDLTCGDVLYKLIHWRNRQDHGRAKRRATETPITEHSTGAHQHSRILLSHNQKEL